jgi:hypothetical protein
MTGNLSTAASRMLKGLLLVLAALCVAASGRGIQAQGATFQKGDLFVGVGNGQVQWRRGDGSLVRVLETGMGAASYCSGLAFDPVGNLLATVLSANTIAKFTASGVLDGTFGTGYSGPGSIVWDNAGNAYVGSSSDPYDLLKFDQSGTPAGSFDAAIDPWGNGVDWISLGADQRTVYYTCESRVIKRFNIGSGSQMADLTANLHDWAFQLRALGDGNVLVADYQHIHLVNASGAIAKTYDVLGIDDWFAVCLDVDGASFWAAGNYSRMVYKFNIASGDVQGFFSAGSSSIGAVMGLAMKGEPNSGEPPAAPSDLRATILSTTSVRLDWTDNSYNETGFEIERRLGTNPWINISTVGSDVTTYTDRGLTPGATYTYRVRAVNAWGTSNWSNEMQVNIGPPAAPSNLAVTCLYSTAISLAWRDNSSNETAFRIERKTGGGSFVEIRAVAADVTTYLNTALAPETTYAYRVRAYNPAGSSGYSNEAAATTLAAPTSLTATTISGTQIQLAWKDNSNLESAYILERRAASGDWAVARNTGANVTSHTDSGLAANARYTYRVRAYRLSSFSSYSGEASATTLAPPAPPSGLSATVVSGTQVRVSWRDNSNNESSFKLERKVGTTPVELSLNANTTAITDSGLLPNTLYTYKVRAYNTAGFSAYSNEGSATTLAPPNAPSDLALTIPAAGQITIQWRDNSDNETDFRPERKTGSGAWVTLRGFPANTTTITDTSVTPGVVYSYRVRAYNAGGFSDYSNAPSITAQ